MISLHVTLYTDGDTDRFCVKSQADPDEPGQLDDVTESYDVVAIATEDGRQGFAVINKEDGK